MTFPQVVAVTPASPAEAAGVLVGDEIRAMNGAVPRDVIDYQFLADEATVTLELERGGLEVEVTVSKHAGDPLGVEVSTPVFDRVRTCDNHCSFCFIYQLPKGMRKSLYVKDDDFRLSFLYGNFTTLTRFTELDLERVITERLGPLYVSIHSTDPELRAAMLHNRRGAMSLRWLRQLLDHQIEVHGQIVVCPGVNDGAALEDTLAGVLERFPEIASLGVVPLGVSRYSKDPSMRAHTRSEVISVLETAISWQHRFLSLLGRRLVFAADEYYLLAGTPFPESEEYEGFPQLENGIGMARSFNDAFCGRAKAHEGKRGGFFASIDGAPAFGYRAPRAGDTGRQRRLDEQAGRTVILTGTYGAAVLRPLLDGEGFEDIETVAVENRFFGGNIGVTGLLTFADVAEVVGRLHGRPRVLLPDVCLSRGRFIDGGDPGELSLPVEVISTEGASLRRVLVGDHSSDGCLRTG